MPLKQGKSKATFAENVKRLIAEGYERKQALAIAYDIQRKNKKKD